MSEMLMRFYKMAELSEITSQLLIYGDLTGQCAHCHGLDVKLSMPKCPSCGANFNYVSFRNVTSHMPKIIKLLTERPDVRIVDYDDYKRNLGKSKAKEFLK